MAHNALRSAVAFATTLVGAAVAAMSAPTIVRAQGTAERPEEIVVTSSLVPTPRREIGTAVSVIDGAAIELRGYDSLADVLRTQPGVSVTNSGGPGKQTALRIRGEDGYRTLLVIDGVKAIDPSATQGGPSFDSLLTTSDLDRIEILRGPQGFIYGADAGGVVNVITATGRGDFGGRLGVQSGSFGTRKIEASVSGGGDGGDYYVSGTDFRTDGFNSQTADTVLADADGADNTTLHAKLGWNPTQNLRLQLVARDTDASAMHDGCFSATTFTTVHDCVGTTTEKVYKVSAEQRTERFTHTFGYSDVDTAHDNFSQGSNLFATRADVSRFEYTGTFDPSASLALVYGLDLQSEQIASPGTQQRDQDGYYVEYQGKFDGRLFVSVGARYDDNEDFGTHTSSRLSAAYVQSLGAERALKYRASYGTGFRAPSLFEISYNRGPFAFPPAAGLALSEETSEGYDLGVEYEAGDGLHLEATYFDQRIEDEIYFDLTTFSGYLQSPGRSTSKGIELGAEMPLAERWRLVANWTNNDTADTQNRQRLRRPENVGNIGVFFEGMSERLQVVANYRISRGSIDMGRIPLDDYDVLDLSMAYSFNGKVQLFARMLNATDQTYQEVIGYNTPGRETYAGIRFTF